MMTREEFDNWLANVKEEELEPFCPFVSGYCDGAYSEECFECQGKVFDFGRGN